MTRRVDGASAGAALVIAILLLVALLALAQGALSLARLELAASAADRRVLQARAAAEVALHRTFTEPVPGDPRGVALWGSLAGPSGTLPEALYRTDLERISREDWLAEGVGIPRNGPGSVRIGRLLWILDPAARVAGARGALEIGASAPLRVDGVVDGMDATAERPPMTPGACGPWRGTLDSLIPTGRLPAVARMPLGGALPQPSLGRLGADTLLALIRTHVSGIGTPGPIETVGGCDTSDPWNWGDPLYPARPCNGYFSVEAAEGNLTVRGGEGQGLLIVRDTLTLADSARFYGMILAGGPLRLGEGARVRGLVRAVGGAEVSAGARLEASACWALLALSRATELLSRPVSQVGSEWIGPFR